MQITGYCVKCKERGRLLMNPIIIENKNGTFMAKGKCEVCDCVICRIMSKVDKEDLENSNE